MEVSEKCAGEKAEPEHHTKRLVTQTDMAVFSQTHK